ncbi:hypothetical protein GCM10011425_28070 [Mucilaginibacter galii]|uniref:Uncharacterized protein n=2 Tax=Mucilaginibacter galii TaxID=2005073 RepID=A0A917J9H0_9SPHI|nr:hypothetical protein GCM10011425_28070 [Mucilaginibacter galii]
MPDAEVLDIFSRLNSYSVTLNDQEKLNANHFGPFKTLADRVAHQFHEFWIRNKILTDAEVLRMGDVTLTADLLIAMIEGIKSKKQIKPYYATFEKSFDPLPEVLEEDFVTTIDTIKGLFGSDLRSTEFRRIHIFYSLFTALYHLQHGLRNINRPVVPIDPHDYPKIASKLERINIIFSEDASTQLKASEAEFLEDSRRATTDTTVRTRRTEFLIDLILS